MTWVVDKHWYYSTACLHEEHDHCRVTCKFCAEPCHCECHQDTDETMVTEPVRSEEQT